MCVRASAWIYKTQMVLISSKRNVFTTTLTQQDASETVEKTFEKPVCLSWQYHLPSEWQWQIQDWFMYCMNSHWKSGISIAVFHLAKQHKGSIVQWMIGHKLLVCNHPGPPGCVADVMKCPYSIWWHHATELLLWIQLQLFLHLIIKS